MAENTDIVGSSSSSAQSVKLNIDYGAMATAVLDAIVKQPPNQPTSDESASTSHQGSPAITHVRPFQRT